MPAARWLSAHVERADALRAVELCDVPERLQRWHWANLFETRGYERLLRALRLRAEAVGVVIVKPHVIPSADEESPPSPAIRESPRTITTPIHLELVRVPAGEFLMGSDPAKDKNARADERPQHRIYVSEFYIGKYPVTNEQYAAFVRATKHKIPEYWKKGEIPQDKENHPVVWVSWDDTVAFCEWLSRASGRTCRLPTEAEWEKAARGTDGQIYPWGNEWDKTKLNSRESGPGGTTAVGHYSPGGDSPYGAVDMAGNVWEWCADWYGDKEYQRQARTAIKDPQGPSQGQGRALRGGSWNGYEDFARCASRLRLISNNRDSNVGFRVVVAPIL